MAIILRENKGSELSFAEVDGNFKSLLFDVTLQGSVLNFYTNNGADVLKRAIDLSLIPAFSGVQVYNGSTLIGSQVSTLEFTGSAVESITLINGTTASILISSSDAFDTFPYSGSAQITGSLGVTGSVDIDLYNYTGGPNSDLRLHSASLQDTTIVLTYNTASGAVGFVDVQSGTSGFAGSNGTSGVAGTSASSGTNGSSGVVGSSGLAGSNGTSGISGTAGSTGANKTSGASGTTGSSGSAGAQGTAGSSGTSATAEIGRAHV